MGPPPQPPPQDADIPKLKAQQAALEQRLSQEITQVQNALKESQSAVTTHFQAQIDKLASKVQIEECVAAFKALEKSEEVHLESLHQTIQTEINAAFERAAQKEDIGAIMQKMETHDTDLKEKHDQEVDELMRGIEGSHNLLTGQIQEAITLAHKEVTEAEQHETQLIGDEISRVDTTIKAVTAQLTDRFEALGRDVVELGARLEQTKTVMQKADMDLAATCETQLREIEQKVREEHEHGINMANQSTNELVEALDLKYKPKLDSIDHAAWTLSNMYTRTVTWQIRGFKHKLHQVLQQQTERVLHSPPFSICAQPDMVLDMLAAPEEESSVPVFVPPLPTAGSASIRLWALPGYHLGFRLTLGEGSSAIARRFEHSFKAGGNTDSVGRACFQMKNLCQLDQIWARKQDTVKVTLEILEMSFGDTESTPAEDEAAETEATPDAALLEEDAADTKDDDLAAAVALHSKVPEDKIFSHRALTSDFLMQERIQGQLQVLKNRTVRRVEWRLEGCTRLLDVLKAGEGVDSPHFSAAGIDKMQLHFYPRGCEVGNNASSNGQPCALYLSGPHRTTIRGVLSVGSNSRQFEQRYQRRGDVGGRGKFCNLETQVDLHDAVTLALEIVEVESDLPEMSASLLFREARNAGSASPGPAKESGAKGSMRMKREDPSKTEEVVRCISLPALNTRQQFLPKVAGGHVGGDRGGKRSR